MKISLCLLGCAAGFAALALTGASAQSPASVSIQLVSTFDFPGTGVSTLPQKIGDKSDVVGTFVDASGVTRGFAMFANGNFSNPLANPADTRRASRKGRWHQWLTSVVCGDYADASRQSP